MKTKSSSLKYESSNFRTLKLTNSGKLEIYWIGTAPMLTTNQTNTSLLVVKGEDHLLIDCGRNVPEAISKYHLKPSLVKNFFITHLHGDHVGGLSFLLTTRRYSPDGLPKANIYGSKEFNDSYLWPYLSFDLGANENNEPKNTTHTNWYNFEGNSPDKNVFWVGKIKVEFFRTKHVPASGKTLDEHAICFGVLIDDKVWYSSDTKFDPELILSCADRCNIMFHDASILTNPVHASIAELKTLPDEIKSKMHLVHYDTTQANNVTLGGLASLVRPGTRFTVL